VAVAIAVPLFAHAFLGGFASEPQTANATATFVNEPSAAHMALLSAAVNPDTVTARGGANISVQDNALLSTGPIGASEVAPQDSTQIRVYTVREGDSLSQVAEMFGVTTNTILWANDLPRATQIRPGDTLVILPVAGVQHKIAAGETLSSIAKKYDGNTDEILSYNQMDDASELNVGDTLIIPGGTVRSVQARAASAKPVKISGSTAASSAGFVHPVPGGVRTQGIHGNNGVDFAAGHGTTIRAAAAGEVIVSKSSGWNGGYGQYVVIRHNNGSQTLYAHLSQNYVGVGAYVAQGEAVGAMGNTGRSTGTHLHFEVRGARNPF
jgi:LysM repeat protein